MTVARDLRTSDHDTVAPPSVKATPTVAVAILEVSPSGHRLHYVRHIVDAAGAQRSVLLTTDEAVRSEEYSVHAASMTGSTTVLLPNTSRRVILANAVTEARRVGAPRLVVPDGDHYLSALALLMLRQPFLPLDIRLLLMRTTTLGGPEPVRPATVIKPFLAQLVRLFPRVKILFLTDALGVVTRRRGFAGLRAVKDPVLRLEESVRRPAWFPPADPSATVVGLFGHITPRKNLPILVQAISAMPDAVLVVGGQLAPGVREFVDKDEKAKALSASGRMVIADRHLETDELTAGLTLADVVAVLNDNDSPSGILAEACVRGTPSIVPDGGWLAEVVTTSGVGVATSLTPEGVVAGLRRVVEDRDTQAEAMRRYSTLIGTSDFTRALLEH